MDPDRARILVLTYIAVLCQRIYFNSYSINTTMVMFVTFSTTLDCIAKHAIPCTGTLGKISLQCTQQNWPAKYFTFLYYTPMHFTCLLYIIHSLHFTDLTTYSYITLTLHCIELYVHYSCCIVPTVLHCSGIFFHCTTLYVRTTLNKTTPAPPLTD